MSIYLEPCRIFINAIINDFSNKLMSQPPNKLLDQLRDQIQLKQFSPRTEKSYVQWVREFIYFQNAKSGCFRHQVKGVCQKSINS